MFQSRAAATGMPSRLVSKCDVNNDLYTSVPCDRAEIGNIS